MVITQASQACDAGSIPVARSIRNQAVLPNGFLFALSAMTLRSSSAHYLGSASIRRVPKYTSSYSRAYLAHSATARCF